MIKIKLLFCLLLWSYCNLSYGQLEKNYSPIQLEGEIPADMMTKVKDLTLSELSSDENTFGEEAGKEYYALSNYAFQEAMQNGKIYFNDEFSTYLGKIVDHLLKDDPEFRKSIRVYATRLPSPNATAWRNGVILFNLPLFSYLESEAEIAFVLAHEISHIKEKHTLLRFKKKMEIGASVYDNSASVEDLFELLRFSRGHELEADNDAIDILKQTNYSLEAASEALKHLKESNSRETIFNRNIKELFQIPDSVFSFKISCDSLDFIGANDTTETSDSLSSHPDIDKRIKIVETILVNNPDSTGRKLFLDTEESFRLLKEKAYFEQIQNYYNRGAYISVLYASLSMARYYPDNQYLFEMAAKSLHWISKCTMDYRRDAVAPKLKGLTGSFGMFHCFFQRVNRYRVVKLAQVFMRKQLERFPESEEISIHLAKAYYTRSDFENAKLSYKNYLETFEKGKHTDYAKIKLQDLRTKESD